MQHATYAHLFTTADGESHFEDISLDLLPTDFSPPTEPVNVAQLLPTAQCFWIGVPVGWKGEMFHPSPQRQILCTVKGEYEVRATDGDVRKFPPGAVLMLEDTTGKGHSTHLNSEGEVLIFGVVLADDD